MLLPLLLLFSLPLEFCHYYHDYNCHYHGCCCCCRYYHQSPYVITNPILIRVTMTSTLDAVKILPTFIVSLMQCNLLALWSFYNVKQATSRTTPHGYLFYHTAISVLERVSWFIRYKWESSMRIYCPLNHTGRFVISWKWYQHFKNVSVSPSSESSFDSITTM